MRTFTKPAATSSSSSSSSSSPLHVQLLKTAPNQQLESPLFTVFPAEIRSEIFTLALSDFPDTESQYVADTLYTRPSYFAPRKSDVRLLRTCRAIYAEAWHLPFTVREQTHWLTSDDRAPPEHHSWVAKYSMLKAAGVIKQAQGIEVVEIQSLRLFAQMWAVEGGRVGGFMRDLVRHGVGPRRVTLTIRHTDWWWWESNHPLTFKGDWLVACRENIPSSVREFHIELESLERKKDQVDSIAQQMAEKWYFVRKDGVALFPDFSGKSVKIDRWSGSSTWQNHTWARDESAPGRIDYYIATVVFRPQWVVARNGGMVNAESVEAVKIAGLFPDPITSAITRTGNTSMDLAWTPPSVLNHEGDEDEEERENEDDEDNDDEEDEEEEDEEDL